MHDWTATDIILMAAWVVGLIYMFVVMPAEILSYARSETTRLKSQSYLRGIVLTAVFFGGGAALVGSITGGLLSFAVTFGDCGQAVPYNGSWSGCRNTTLWVPGDKLGYWNIWVADWTQGARAAFVWD